MLFDFLSKKGCLFFFLSVCKGCTKAAYPPYLLPNIQWPWELDGVSEWYWHPNWWSFLGLVEGWHWSCKVCVSWVKKKTNTIGPDFGCKKNTTRPALLVVCVHSLWRVDECISIAFSKKELTMVVIVLSCLFRISDFQNGSVEDWQFPIHPHPTETPLLFLKNRTGLFKCVSLQRKPDPKQCIRSKPSLPCKPKNTHKNSLYVWGFPKMMVPNNHGFSY